MEDTPILLRDSFIQIPLGDHLILSDKVEKILIISPEGRFILQKYFQGKPLDGIARMIEQNTGFPTEKTWSFVTSFLSSLKEQVRPLPKKVEVTESHPLSSLASHVTKGYNLYGKRCLIHYGSMETLNILHPLLVHAESTKSSEKTDLTFHLTATDDIYAFYRNGKELVREKSLFYVKNVALFEIYDALYPEKTWLTVFHGAVVQKNRRAVILSGTSGKGKSTLTAYLIGRGFTLISDDLAILESENAGVMATPYAVSLKEDTWNILSSHIPEISSLEPHKIYGESLKFYMPGNPPDKPPDPVEDAHLFFIHYENGTDVKLEPLTPVETLKKIIGIGAWISHEADHLRRLMTWLEATPAYELTYPDLESAETKIREVLEPEKKPGTS